MYTYYDILCSIIVLVICLIITVVLFVPIFINHSDYLQSTSYNPYDNFIPENIKGNTNKELLFESIYVINLDRYPDRYEYVKSQLNNLGLTKYQKWIGTDGFYTSTQDLLNLGLSNELVNRKGLAGCAASHIRLWRHILENKLDWVLILEDDAHFHPDFVTLFKVYTSYMNVNNALMIFPGYCGNEDINKIEKTKVPIINAPVMCLHAYMISHVGAKYLLDNLLPIKEPIDIAIIKHFKNNNFGKCYVFNGNTYANGIRPHDYKEKNGSRCQFSGIIYQNQKDQGSTIHQPEIVYEHS